MHTILFTGHRPDALDRPVPRFPASCVPAASDAIRAAIGSLAATHHPCRGMAGGASGGDILFHESCLELGVPTGLYLALAPAAFTTASVAPSGDSWVQRFAALVSRLPPPAILDPHAPAAAAGDARLWARANDWLLDLAVVHGPDAVTLLALWDGGEGDGDGGTYALVSSSRARGIRTVVLDPRHLCRAPAR